MVVFTCAHCGESVNKPKVEKHYMTKCRNRTPNLSCMDCFKDFLGQDFEVHTKCVTEEQRYSAKGFQAKAKKGEQKQNTWVEMVQSVLDEQKNAPRSVLRIIEEIVKHTNTPRKKPKFINFVKNVCGHRTFPKDIDAAWELISVKLSDLSNAGKNQNQNKVQNGTSFDKKDVSLNGSDVKNDSVESNDSQANISQSNDLVSGETEVKDKKLKKNKKNKQNGLASTSNENMNDSNNVDGNETKTEITEVPEVKTKKQRKEEKKRQKYEAMLKSATVKPDEEPESKVAKKAKKHESKTAADYAIEDSGNKQNGLECKAKKNKKRKNEEVIETENIEAASEETTKKKKRKLKNGTQDTAELEMESLHDQNVNSNQMELHNGTKKDKFNWHDVIISVLQKKGEMPYKRLQKKVLSEYMEVTGLEADDRIAEKLMKKLKSAPNVLVDKNRVSLVDV